MQASLKALGFCGRERIGLDSQSALLEGMEVFCGSVHLLRYGYGLGLFFFWLSCEPKKKEVKFDIDCSYILVSDPLQSPVRPTPSRRLNKLERPGYLSEWVRRRAAWTRMRQNGLFYFSAPLKDILKYRLPYRTIHMMCRLRVILQVT